MLKTLNTLASKFQWVLFVCLSSFASAQSIISPINFDDGNSQLYYLDTAEGKSCQWEVSTLAMKNFGPSLSPDSCIVTNKNSGYLSSDTSSFVIRIITPARANVFLSQRYFSFYYKLDVGSSGDYGSLEYSWRDGNKWEAINESTNFIDNGPYIFNQNQKEWTLIECNFDILGPIERDADTLFVKFVFVSDSIPDSKDGWAIDNISIKDSFRLQTGLKDNPIGSTLNYNPFEKYFYLDNPDLDHLESIQLFSVSGAQLTKVKISSLRDGRWYLPALDLGSYFVVFKFDTSIIRKKITINN